MAKKGSSFRLTDAEWKRLAELSVEHGISGGRVIGGLILGKLSAGVRLDEPVVEAPEDRVRRAKARSVAAPEIERPAWKNDPPVSGRRPAALAGTAPVGSLLKGKKP